MMTCRPFSKTALAILVAAWAPAALAAPSEEGARTTEERLEELESRLARLEGSLERILERLEAVVGPDEAHAVRQEARQAVEGTGRPAGSVREGITAQGAQPSAKSGEKGDKQQAQASVVNEPVVEAKRVDYGGYMEMHLNHDNVNPTTLDFHRFVLLYGHEFNDRIRFVGEVEIEHALVEGGEQSGELELEQAYLDFLVRPNLSFRAGMMLVPIGIINERHEPAGFNGVERPFVDSLIIPTTWFGNGAGMVGELAGGLSFKAFAMSSLNASFFSAAEGFRDGRQKGFFDNASNIAAIGRLEYAGIDNLNLGVSYWGGNTAFDFDGISGRAGIFEVDGQYSCKRLDLKAQLALTHLEDADEINRALQRTSGVNPNIAEKMLGYSLEGALRLLPLEAAHNLSAFYRFEKFDTQHRMPDGFLPLPQFNRHAHVIGLTYFPHPDIALKFDHNFMGNASQVVRIPNRWNFGIGWWF